MNISSEITGIQLIKLLMLLLELLIAILIIVIDWLYLVRMMIASRQVDLEPPGRPAIFMKAGIVSAIITAFLILVFLFTGYY